MPGGIVLQVSRWLGVDPGTAHCGMSLWNDGACTFAAESTPGYYADFILDHVAAFDTVYIEDYTPDGGFGSGGSARTLELIGLTRHACRRAGVEFVAVTRRDRAASQKRAKAAGFRVPNDHAFSSVAVVVAARRIPVSELEDALGQVSS